jgi:hypothetical protein
LLNTLIQQQRRSHTFSVYLQSLARKILYKKGRVRAPDNRRIENAGVWSFSMMEKHHIVDKKLELLLTLPQA